MDRFWGLPEYPRTPYYRTFETTVNGEAHFFEFVVPMVPPLWNDASRMADYRDLLRDPPYPTAVALSTLEVRLPAVNPGEIYHTHWTLADFVLDGHHKLAAAAESGRALHLLSLLSLDNGNSDVDVKQIRAIRSQDRVPAPRRRSSGATSTAASG